MPANHNSEARTKCQNEVRNYHNKGILSPKRTRSMGDLRLDASTRRDQIAKWHQEHNEASDEILKSFQQVAVLVKNVAGQMEISRATYSHGKKCDVQGQDVGLWLEYVPEISIVVSGRRLGQNYIENGKYRPDTDSSGEHASQGMLNKWNMISHSCTSLSSGSDF
ncbi:hypothetical protein HCEG_07905 [Histoplasma capsulatum var. duboisii H88]|uniref:Uncharacterized protein n=1 Tax=Ajellomyces capsulatus (strain H88) TaxID=544711 RepID=F0US13_AJEC8|nr:hypothetical protein HCEG_07905 [Histoplasma capsulatum var. duboisii H88]